MTDTQNKATAELRATLLDIAAEHRDSDKRGLSFSAAMVADACEAAAYALSGTGATKASPDESGQLVPMLLPENWVCVPALAPDAMVHTLTGYSLESLSNRRDETVIRERAVKRWSDLLAAAGGIPIGKPSPYYAVVASCGQGVIFSNLQDARWTLTGEGTGSDGFGVPTIGDAFRESYSTGLTMVRLLHVGQKGGAA